MIVLGCQPDQATRPGTMRLRGLLLLVGLLALMLHSGGCVGTGPCRWVRNGFKVGPNYGRPPAPLAHAWVEADDPRAQEPPRDGDWWNVFQDPILTGLVYRAYRQNPNLAAAGSRVLQARGQQAIAAGNLWPQTQQGLGLYPRGTFAGNPTSIAVTAFNLSWEVDFWGKYRRQVESANARLDASVEDYDDALVTLLADVATNYVQYRVAQQRLTIARSNLQAQEKLVAVAARQRKVGTTTALDEDQLRTLMEQTRSALPALEITRGQANDRLCILLGEPPHDLEPELGFGREPGEMPLPQTPAAVGVGIPADLLRRRPDVRAAERQAAAQSAQIGVAEADLYPSLSIGAMLGQANFALGSALGSALASGGFFSFFTPQFSWRLLNYGRICNNVHVQKAKTEERIAQYQAKVLAAAQEVQTALRGFLRSQEQADALWRSVAAAADASRIAEARFDELKADVNRLFTLENARLQAQDQLAIAQGNIALNLINVYRSLGGGWEIRLPAAPCSPPVVMLPPQSEPPSGAETGPTPRPQGHGR